VHVKYSCKRKPVSEIGVEVLLWPFFLKKKKIPILAHTTASDATIMGLRILLR